MTGVRVVSVLAFALLSQIAVADSSHTSVRSDEIDAYLMSAKKSLVACGPVSLWYALRSRGHTVSVDDLIGRAEIDNNGVRLGALLELAKGFEPKAEAITVSDKDLKFVTVPAILVVSKTHCVVLAGFSPRGDEAYIFDPTSKKTRTETIEMTRHYWTGEAIVFSRNTETTWRFVALNTAVLFLSSGAAFVLLWRRRSQ